MEYEMKETMEEKIKKLIKKSLNDLGVDVTEVSLEHPDDISHGDYSTNVAMVYSKEVKMKPRELAEDVERIEVAGPGFINFFLSREFFTKSVVEIFASGENFGKNTSLAGKKVMVEYTDPNPFKPFHIGHLMANAI